MEKFFDNKLNCTMVQINKTSAKKFFEAEKEIFLQSSNMPFNSFWQSAYRIQKDKYSVDSTFDRIINEFTYYNCDSERGKYIHFYIRENDMKKEKVWKKDLSFEEINEMSVRQINAYFLHFDESNKFPICGKFNATKRAINRIRRQKKAGLMLDPGLEYYLYLENEISNIVNAEI